MPSDKISNHSVDRALDVLVYIADHNAEGAVFSVIAHDLKIPKSTLVNLLASLINKNFLTFNAKEKTYYLGEELFNLGNRFVDNSNLLSSIERIMINAVNETKYTSFFGVLSGNEVRYLLRKVSDSLITPPASPQYALKASCTGLGKAMLFQQSYEQIKKMFDDGMPKITPKTITDVAVLYKQLQEMKVDDISHENEESSPGIQCYGTPVRYNERIIAAVSISFPAWISDTEQLQKIKNSLLQEKKQIERIISNNPSRWIYSNLK